MNKLIKLLIYLFLLIPIVAFSDDTWKIYDDSQVAVVRITVDTTDLAFLYENVDNDDHFPATVHFINAHIDEIIDSVGFRLRGNTSRTAAKKSFKLSFNTFVAGRQFYGIDKLNLNGEHNDPAIIRSKLCWDFFQQIGMGASKASHAAVYINDVYYGLYISVEHIDDEFIQSRFDDDSGNLWKCLYPADLTYRGPEPINYHPYYELTRPYELKTNVEQFDYTQLARLIDVINNTPDDVLADSLEQILIVPEVLKYFAMNVLVGGWDDYWFLMNNYYLYYEPSIDKFHLIPYDYDNTLGIDWFNVDWTATNPYHFITIEETQGSDRGFRPLADRLMNNASYRNLYTHFLRFFKDNIFRLSLWESRLDSLKEMITPWAESDNYRTLDYGFDIGDFHNSYTYASYSNLHVKRGIKEFINHRDASILGQTSWLDAAPSIYSLEWIPKYPQPDDSIYISASAFSSEGLSDLLVLFYPGNSTTADTLEMIFQPIPGTTVVEEADRWLGVIPPLGPTEYGSFQLVARDTDGKESVYPKSYRQYIKTPTTDTTGLVINEFLANNTHVNTDPAGEYDDWLEIHNPISETISLGGMYLTDNPEDLRKWEIPSEAGSLSGGDYILFWCDENGTQEGLHTNFKISASGEFLALVSSDGISIIDSLSFGPQFADISYGRNPDAGDAWQLFDPPTPEYSNLTTDIIDDHAPPNTYKLFQNFPNPFNPTTAIGYRLSAVSDVELSIYNLLGEKVVTLVSERQQVGKHQVEWNASGYASGVYYYRIVAGDFQQIMKMILLK
jgi:hypothetical protein